MVRAGWVIIIILPAGHLRAAALPRPANEPLTQDDILYLLNNYVPSQSVADLARENGVNFDPEEGPGRRWERGLARGASKCPRIGVGAPGGDE